MIAPGGSFIDPPPCPSLRGGRGEPMLVCFRALIDPSARMEGSFPGVLTPTVASILRDRGVITERQLQEAIQHQVLYGGRLGTSLYELGFITEERLREALARAHGVPAADLREVQAEALELLPKKLAARHKVFPCQVRGKTMFLGMGNPADHSSAAAGGYSLGYIVGPIVLPEFRM